MVLVTHAVVEPDFLLEVEKVAEREEMGDLVIIDDAVFTPEAEAVAVLSALLEEKAEKVGDSVATLGVAESEGDPVDESVRVLVAISVGDVDADVEEVSVAE